MIAWPKNEDEKDELERGSLFAAGTVDSRLNSISCTLADDGCIVTTSKQFNDGSTPIKYGPTLHTVDGLLDHKIGYSKNGLPFVS